MGQTRLKTAGACQRLGVRSRGRRARRPVSGERDFDTALDGLQADRGQLTRGECAQQGHAEAGLPDARAAAENYDTHASFTARARRLMSAGVKVAFTVSRKRAAPIGTVGGRMACARTPQLRKRSAAHNTRSFSPRITETIGPKEFG